MVWVILAWNLYTDVGIVLDPEAANEGETMPAIFDTQDEAAEFAVSNCAFNYRMVEIR